MNHGGERRRRRGWERSRDREETPKEWKNDAKEGERNDPQEN